MSIIKTDDIAGARLENLLVCSDCITDEEWTGLKEEEIVTRREVDDSEDLFFCDRCEERL